jgi:hypothetical protein
MSTTRVAQVLRKSCWAAALEMFTDAKLKQCDLLKADFNRADPTSAPDFCDPAWQEDNAGRFEGNTKLLSDVAIELRRDRSNPIPFVRRSSRPSFANLQRNIDSSAIVLHSWDSSGDQHFIVPTDTFVQQLTRNKIHWIKVLDPFPELQGRTYYLNHVEFRSDDWFVGIIYHRQISVSSTPNAGPFTNLDPKLLVGKYIGQLPANITGDFKTDTNASRSHIIADYEFTVTNTNVELLLDNADVFFNNILALARDMKMYLAGSNNKYTSFFLNANNSGQYYLAMIEDGTRYVPVVSSAADVANLAMVSASAQPRSVNASESKVPEKPGNIEKAFLEYFAKRPRAALICRFFDVGQEYVFFMKEGKVQVFDPFKSFSYLLPKDHKKPSYLPLDEFFNALTQFYPFLKDKKYGK